MGAINQFDEINGFGKHKPIAISLLQKTICALGDIDHFLISGTLLGYERHNDFIPWDDDIDLLVKEDISSNISELIDKNKDLVFLSKYPSMLRICFKEQGIEINGDSQNWKNNMLSEGIYKWPFVDLFTYKSEEDHISFFKKNWPKDEFFPAKKVSFLGMEVSVPRNPSYFLERNYGKGYMTTLKSSCFSHKSEMIKNSKTITMDQYNAGKSITHPPKRVGL